MNGPNSRGEFELPVRDTWLRVFYNPQTEELRFPLTTEGWWNNPRVIEGSLAGGRLVVENGPDGHRERRVLQHEPGKVGLSLVREPAPTP